MSKKFSIDLEINRISKVNHLVGESCKKRGEYGIIYAQQLNLSDNLKDRLLISGNLNYVLNYFKYYIIVAFSENNLPYSNKSRRFFLFHTNDCHPNSVTSRILDRNKYPYAFIIFSPRSKKIIKIYGNDNKFQVVYDKIPFINTYYHFCKELDHKNKKELVDICLTLCGTNPPSFYFFEKSQIKSFIKSFVKRNINTINL